MEEGGRKEREREGELLVKIKLKGRGFWQISGRNLCRNTAAFSLSCSVLLLHNQSIPSDCVYIFLLSTFIMVLPLFAINLSFEFHTFIFLTSIICRFQLFHLLHPPQQREKREEEEEQKQQQEAEHRLSFLGDKDEPSLSIYTYKHNLI